MVRLSVAAMSLVVASAAHAEDVGGGVAEGLAISGLMLLGVAAAASLAFALRLRDQEQTRRPQSLLLKRGRRYTQP